MTGPACSFCSSIAIDYDTRTHLMHCKTHPSSSLPEEWFDPNLKWVSTQEASKILRVCENTMNNWRKTGKLRTMGIVLTRMGLRWYYGFPIRTASISHTLSQVITK